MSLEEQEQTIIVLQKENQALRERIAELERRLGMDSQTSSKPPSSDGLKKKNTHRTIRELKALEEIEQESWAFSMKKLLTLANKYRHRYPSTIPKAIVIRLTKLYESILHRGLDFHESQPPLIRKSKFGQVKRRVGHNLLLRLKNYASDVLRFLFEPHVPFTFSSSIDTACPYQNILAIAHSFIRGSEIFLNDITDSIILGLFIRFFLFDISEKPFYEPFFTRLEFT